MSEAFDIGTAIALGDGVAEQRSRARHDAASAGLALLGGAVPVWRLRAAGAAAVSAGGAALGTAPKRMAGVGDGGTARPDGPGGWAVAGDGAAPPAPSPAVTAAEARPAAAAALPGGKLGAASAVPSVGRTVQVPPATAATGAARAPGLPRPAWSVSPVSPRAGVLSAAGAPQVTARAAGGRAGGPATFARGVPGAAGAAERLHGGRLHGGRPGAAPAMPAAAPQAVPDGSREAVGGVGRSGPGGTAAAPRGRTGSGWSAPALGGAGGAAPDAWRTAPVAGRASEGAAGDDATSTGAGGGGDDGAGGGGHGGANPAQLEGDVFLDGALVGRWMSRWMTREAERASAGRTGFDVRRGRLLPGPTVGT